MTRQHHKLLADSRFTAAILTAISLHLAWCLGQPVAQAAAVQGGRVVVVNTPAATVDVIDANSRAIVARVNAGIDPVSIAVRPDGKEVWVANRVSDSVSVIDSVPSSPTHLQVNATVQDFDPATKATRFDEPVGNREGNTPLHAAAFLCRTDLVKLLLEQGASPTQRNNRRESALDAVSGRWSDDLAGFYSVLEATSDLELDLARIQAERPRMAQLLRAHAEKPQRGADKSQDAATLRP